VVVLICLIFILVAPGGVTIGGSARQATATSECQSWADCRSRALEAEAASDYERFHDLAWRAMQKRGASDADVMLMLARAQTLSGRPHDGLVMLRRIAELGVAPTDALTSDAFARARALPEWPDVAQLISSTATKPAPSVAAGATPGSRRRSTRTRATDLAAAVSPGTSSPVGAQQGPSLAADAGTPPEEAIRLQLRNIVPAGLAHDVASGRLLVGNRLGRSVITISERLKTAMDLVRADSAGFLDVLAIAIDARRGDLWVASARDGGNADSNAAPTAALHKLQLVSGRPLLKLPIDTGDLPARFTDLSVTPSGAVFLLDQAGGRVWKLAPGKQDPALVTTLDLVEPIALAIDDAERHLYVAHQDGLSRVSTSGTNPVPVNAPEGMDLSKIENLNWYRGSLVGIERGPDANRRLMRWHLNPRGTSIARVETIDPAIPTAGRGGTATVSGKDVYYLAAEPESSSHDASLALVVRRARLQ
jgi:hypothetical protein